MKKIIILFFLSFLFNSISLASTDSNEKICSGFSKWTEDGEFKQVRESKCMTQDEYNAYLNSPDYLCKYYQKSIWKESERAYGKKQYQFTEKSLVKINTLKAEGKALCEAGKLKEGELKLVEAITIISHTKMN